jgi:hypothetical protein
MKNRDRLLDGDTADAFFTAIQGQARNRGLLSDRHFGEQKGAFKQRAAAE